eukprot:CAMPEP_0197245588 /NCGR_PEP_ID=MMETSP1429-20130617/10331_1 /TAXON_ID=49237 /ORGANISM="Chaetoceros  sp., Strain UNC1202" /LENGTH=278 /DNA_ID=CAMNT_0042706119 /DNA_START=71 /DNA_END=907 /DNA_ORIENTATION=-
MAHTFAPQPFTGRQPLTHSTRTIADLNTLTSLSMAKKKGNKKSKGFGKQTAEPATIATQSDLEPTTSSSSSSSSSSAQEAEVETPLNKNYGAEALDRLRRQKVETRNEELRQIRDLKNVDNLLSNEPDAAVIPEPVAQRMGKRMLPFVGVPLFGGMGAFVAFWYFATYKNYEFQPALVAFSTIAILVFGLLGITYSVMSASWDVEEEGSALGFDEFKKNLGSIRDGLRRTRENAILREKMASVPDEEIDLALRNLDKKEQVSKVKNMSLEDKLKNELE